MRIQIGRIQTREFTTVTLALECGLDLGLQTLGDRYEVQRRQTVFVRFVVQVAKRVVLAAIQFLLQLVECSQQQVILLFKLDQFLRQFVLAFVAQLQCGL